MFILEKNERPKINGLKKIGGKKKKQRKPPGSSMKGIIKIKVQTPAKSKKNIEKTKQKLAL